jgi:hypothetical protein
MQEQLPPHGQPSSISYDDIREARSRARTRYTVCPGAWLSIREGVRLEAGDAVDPAALTHTMFARLRDRKVVFELDSLDLDRRVMTGEHSHIVLKSITGSARGILVAGQSTGPSDWARPAVAEIPALPMRRHVTGAVLEATPGVPAMPAVDGAERLRALEQNGLVRPLTAADRKNPPPIAS